MLALMKERLLSQEAIDGMHARRKGDDAAMTVLIVAHRLSAVRNADVVFVVQDSKVVEDGSHDKLILEEKGTHCNHRQINAQNKIENKKLYTFLHLILLL